MPVLDRDKERNIYFQAKQQGKSDDFIKDAVQRFRVQEQQRIDTTALDERQTGFGANLIKGPAEGAGFFSKIGHGLASNVTKFGQSIAGAVGSSALKDEAAGLETAQATEQQSINALAQRIREKNARGEDTKQMTEALRTTLNMQNTQLFGDILNESTGGSLDKTGKQVFGEALGVATDVLGAGVLPGGIGGVVKAGKGTFGALAAGVKAGAKGGLVFGGSQGFATGMQENLDAKGIALSGIGGAAIGGIAGGVLGGALGGASDAIRFVKTPAVQRTITRRLGALDTLQKSYKTLDKEIVAANKSGMDTKKFLAESDLLIDAVDKNGKISTKAAVSNLEEILSPYESAVGDALEKEGKSIDLMDVWNKGVKNIEDSTLVGTLKKTTLTRLAKELDAIDDGTGNALLKTVHDLKVQTNRTNAKSFLDPEKNEIGKILGRTFKEFVEEGSDAIDVKGFNAELRKLYSVRDVLEAMDGKTVQGGKLGKYFSQTIGAVAGGQVGGVPGAIAGAEIGGAVRGSQLKRAFGGKGGKAVEPTKAMMDALVQSSREGSLKTTQSATSNIPKNVIPKTVPPKVPLGKVSLGKSTSNVIQKPVKQKTKSVPVTKKPTKKVPPAPVTLADKVKQVSKDFIDIVNKNPGSVHNAGAIAKGEGFRTSALLRKLRGEPTAIETSNALKYLKSNHVGKKVTHNAEQVTVEGHAFGKVKIKLADGSIKYVEKETLKAQPVTGEGAVAFLKSEATKEANQMTRASGKTLKNRQGGFMLTGGGNKKKWTLTFKDGDKTIKLEDLTDANLRNWAARLDEQGVKYTQKLQPTRKLNTKKGMINPSKIKDDVVGALKTKGAKTPEAKLIQEAKKYNSAEEFIKGQGETPKTTRVWIKSKFSNKGHYSEIPIIRKVENTTLYQGGDKNRQFWTPNKKYAEQFGKVSEKTGSFYQIDNGNRVTDVFVEVNIKTKQQLTDIYNKANK